jgi:hypothetical protein
MSCENGRDQDRARPSWGLSSLMSYEEALATDPIVASWISFAQNAALGPHTYILEDRPWLLAVSGPHADEG